eukprot:CAMPEP_0172753540 /NCGR_PEP_ID=MMETSP1074-20121228/156171_1 /TAXON_ID=2916 /ORGANISM="Ceratium fusus, Strain PA161109" /LENGTH=50 /DNA_ID=CAMNT_0013586245 /DNA_START=167 /DNA_END=316 /DNA_ORIENTATION=+
MTRSNAQSHNREHANLLLPCDRALGGMLDQELVQRLESGVFAQHSLWHIH